MTNSKVASPTARLGYSHKDGSITIHFGGDPKSVNYLPITEGWNHAIRMYEPRSENLDGSSTFPSIEPMK